MKRLRLLLQITTGLVCALAMAGPAAALEPQGIAITPAVQDKALGPLETTTSFTVQLANQTAKPVTFSLSTTDFTSLNETGGLTFLGTDSKRVTSGHGLSSILQLDTKVVTLQPNTTKPITARINDVRQLAPGGHYGAILAQALPNRQTAQGNNVSINQVVSSLIFLETAGQGTKTLDLLKPEFENLSFKLPDSIGLVFKSTGNTQTIPRGRVVITRGNTEVMEGVINENSSLLLPASSRLLPVQLIGDRKPLRPGLYKLQVQYRYEGSLGTTTYSKTFLYINIRALLLGLLALALVLYGGFRSRRYWKKLRLAASVPLAVQKRLIIVRNRSTAAHKVVVRHVGKEPVVTDKTDL